MAIKKKITLRNVWNQTMSLARDTVSASRIIIEKFISDFGFQRAGSLAYSTLISLIPIAALSFTLFSSFSFFSQSMGTLKTRLFQHLIPSQVDIIQKYVEDFAANMSSLNTISIIAFMFLGLLLLNNLKNHLNAIWKIRSKRPFFQSLTRFWTVLTLGPLLIGISFYITNNIGVEGLLENHPGLSILFSYLVNLVLMFLLYFVTPDIPVKVRAAFTGAVFSGFFFEIAKNIFTRYSGILIQTQAQIYKSLAVLPLFLLWIFLVWIIILLGAEISYFVQFPPDLKTHDHPLNRSFARKLSVFLIIVRLYLEDHNKIDKKTIHHFCKDASPQELQYTLMILIQHKLILFSEQRGYIPFSEPGKKNLAQVIISLLEIGETDMGQDELDQILKRLRSKIKKEFNEDLISLYEKAAS